MTDDTLDHQFPNEAQQSNIVSGAQGVAGEGSVDAHDGLFSEGAGGGPGGIIGIDNSQPNDGGNTGVAMQDASSGLFNFREKAGGGSGDVSGRSSSHRRWAKGVLKTPVCTPCDPQSKDVGSISPLRQSVIEMMNRRTPLCICEHGAGLGSSRCVIRAVPNHHYCEDCDPISCSCICIHCYPHLIHEDDYDEDYDVAHVSQIGSHT